MLSVKTAEGDLMIFDCNVIFGHENTRNLDISAVRVLEIMDEKGIDRAMLVNKRCMFSDFRRGNDETAQLVTDHPDRFVGVCSLNPSQYLFVMGEIDRCFDKLGMCVFRLFNTGDSFISGWGGGLDSLTIRAIMTQLTAKKAVVFIEGGYPFAAIYDMAVRYADIDFIASGVGYGNMGEAILAVQKTDNLYLDLSTLDSMGGVDILCRHAGVTRLIFGTGLPYCGPSSELLMVKSANISHGDRCRIFSGNLLDLLEKHGIRGMNL